MFDNGTVCSSRGSGVGDEVESEGLECLGDNNHDGGNGFALVGEGKDFASEWFGLASSVELRASAGCRLLGKSCFLVCIGSILGFEAPGDLASLFEDFSRLGEAGMDTKCSISRGEGGAVGVEEWIVSIEIRSRQLGDASEVVSRVSTR